MYDWFSLMMMMLLFCVSVFKWIVAAEEFCPYSPNEYGASNYCKEAKYYVAEFGVFKSTPNKLVIH